MSVFEFQFTFLFVLSQYYHRCLNPSSDFRKYFKRNNGLPSLVNPALWFTWCMRCKHGGHANHMVGWFKKHLTCPVPGCDCQCQIDAIEMQGRLWSKMTEFNLANLVITMTVHLNTRKHRSCPGKYRSDYDVSPPTYLYGADNGFFRRHEGKEITTRAFGPGMYPHQVGRKILSSCWI